MSLFYKEEDKNKNPSAIKYPDLPNSQQEPQKASAEQSFPSRQADPRGSIYIKKSQQQVKKEEEKATGCCACLSLSYYKDYFKVTNADVMKRITSNLKFWDGQFFIPPDQQYDLYGPFWLYTTLIFVVSAVHNILIYQNTSGFSYDFGSMGQAFGIFYLEGLGFSAAFGGILKCSGVNCTIMQIICLYGYSISIYIICVLLCCINISYLAWALLLYACGTKIAFILKNLFSGLEIPTAKKIMVIAIVAVEAALQFFIIKLMFIYSPTPTSTTTASHFQILRDGLMHMRVFESI